MTANWNGVNMACVVVGRVRSEIVNSFDKALRTVYPHSLAKHTIDSNCISFIQLETTSNLSIFTFYKRSIDLYT